MAEAPPPEPSQAPPAEEAHAVLEREFAFLDEVGRYEAFLRLYHGEEPEQRRALGRMCRSRDPLIPLILLQYLAEIPERRAVFLILDMIEEGNDIVARVAMDSYRANHYPAKARLLKRLILSPSERGCRFAVRTLSRAGMQEALPLILRELPERHGGARREMIAALRFLPDRRSIALLVPIAETAEEADRAAAMETLEELQGRFRSIPAEFFVRRLQDESGRVRRVALEALQRFPTRQVAGLLLERARDASEPESSREKAIRALGVFGDPELAAPLARLMADPSSPTLALAAEAALRSYPPPVARAEMLKLLSSEEQDLHHHAALFLAEHFAGDAIVRRRLLDLWTRGDEAQQAAWVEVLRILGGPEPARLLLAASRRSPVLAYAAAGALGRLKGAGAPPAMLALILDPATPTAAKQALLSQWARRGPEDSVRSELGPWLLEALGSEVLNIRYLALQNLEWFPFEEALPGVLGLLARETSTEVVRLAHHQLLVGLGRDPRPLAAALRDHPDRGALAGHAVKLFCGQAWDPGAVAGVLEILEAPPLDWRRSRPEAYLAVCSHFLERGALKLEDVWERVGDSEARLELLRLVLARMKSPRRRFPPLPLAWLAGRMSGEAAEGRALYYELLAAEARPESVRDLAAALLREEDPSLITRGRDLLRGLTGGGPP